MSFDLLLCFLAPQVTNQTTNITYSKVIQGKDM